MSGGSSQWSASGPSGSCTEKELIIPAWANGFSGQLAAWLSHAEVPGRLGTGPAAFGVVGADGDPVPCGALLLRDLFCQIDDLGVDSGFLDRVNTLVRAVGWLDNTALG
jgi:hypothetical protein